MSYDLKPWQKFAIGATIVGAIAGYCIKDVQERNEAITEERIGKRSAPAIPGYAEHVKEVEYGRRPALANRYSRIGRLQRTKRWDPLIDAVEDRYRIPDGLLAGVIMEESCGDPVQPNATGDGGLGLAHFQPPTARHYGLHVYGATNGRSRDPSNGRAIRRLIRNCAGSVPCISEKDDRAHLLRNLDAIARLIVDGKRRHGSWDLGVRTINWYGTNYVGRVRQWQSVYNSNQWNAQAEADFNRRNPQLQYDDWIDNSHDRMVNWGLREYATAQNTQQKEINKAKKPSSKHTKRRHAQRGR
jgi:hypothetical protein